jgi:hypothetical protein
MKKLMDKNKKQIMDENKKLIKDFFSYGKGINVNPTFLDKIQRGELKEIIKLTEYEHHSKIPCLTITYQNLSIADILDHYPQENEGSNESLRKEAIKVLTERLNIDEQNLRNAMKKAWQKEITLDFQLETLKTRIENRDYRKSYIQDNYIISTLELLEEAYKDLNKKVESKKIKDCSEFLCKKYL